MPLRLLLHTLNNLIVTTCLLRPVLHDRAEYAVGIRARNAVLAAVTKVSCSCQILQRLLECFEFAFELTDAEVGLVDRSVLSTLPLGA